MISAALEHLAGRTSDVGCGVLPVMSMSPVTDWKLESPTRVMMI